MISPELLYLYLWVLHGKDSVEAIKRRNNRFFYDGQELFYFCGLKCGKREGWYNVALMKKIIG